MHTPTRRHLQVNRAIVAPVLLLVCTAWSSAHAAEKVRVTGSWQQGVSHDQTFTRILVVGITPDVDQRCRWERFLAAKLNGATTKAVSTCDALTEKELDPLTVESIKGAVEWLKADAVITTSLVAREWTAEEGGGRDTRGTANYKATDAGLTYGYYGMYGVPVVYAEFETQPSVTELQGKVQVQTRVFSVAGPALVYEMDTTVGDITSTGTGLYQITEPIAKHLERAGLLQ